MKIADWKTAFVFDNIRMPCDIGDERITMTAKENGYSFGHVTGEISGVQGGHIYDIRVNRSGAGIHGNATAITTWLRADRTMSSRNYLMPESDSLLRLRIHVPEDVNRLQIEYEMWSYGGGTASFSMPAITDCGAYVKRNVTLAAAWFDTGTDGSMEANLRQYLRVIDNAGGAETKPDILVFSEQTYYNNIAFQTLADCALTVDSVPILAIRDKAREYGMYVVMGMIEDEGGYYKNIALVIGRDGEIVGKYAKTHLPLVELEGGLVPGNELPVFELDFGCVGILICWDHYYPEPARILRQKGAELLLIPTAGYTVHQSRSRAVECGAYTVIVCDKEIGHNEIISPRGEVLARVTDEEQGFVSHTIDLNERAYTYWLSVGPTNGENRDILQIERRPDLYGPLVRAL